MGNLLAFQLEIRHNISSNINGEEPPVELEGTPF
jgi:hypothetical protein